MDDIVNELRALASPSYKVFTERIIPTLSGDCILGVRSVDVQRLARRLKGTPQAEAFLQELPHRFLEENGLHSCLVCGIRDFTTCLAEVDRFLPFVDNWGTCDGLHPRVFGQHLAELLPHAFRWTADGRTYVRRYGIGVFMSYFLECTVYELPAGATVALSDIMGQIAAIRSEEYYVNMMTAWYFATALAKQWEVALPFIENHRLDMWTHNRAIQKAVESRRVTPEHKLLLRGLRR